MLTPILREVSVSSVNSMGRTFPRQYDRHIYAGFPSTWVSHSCTTLLLAVPKLRGLVGAMDLSGWWILQPRCVFRHSSNFSNTKLSAEGALVLCKTRSRTGTSVLAALMLIPDWVPVCRAEENNRVPLYGANTTSLSHTLSLSRSVCVSNDRMFLSY